MLSSFRSHIKGWAAWAFIIIVSVPFALWGIGNYSSVITSNYVASVNGEAISPQTFQDTYRSAYQQRQEALGGKWDPSDAEVKALKQQTLNRLITIALLRQKAGEYNMIASQGRVRQHIRSMPVFQVDGKFSFQQYRAILAANQQTPDQFEALIRTDLRTRILQRGLSGTTFATPASANAIIDLLQQQRKVAWLTLPLENFKPATPPSEEAITAYYQAHKEAFTTPESLTLKYVQIDPETLKAGITASEDDLLAWYHSHLSAFGTPPARKAAEILISPDGSNAQAWSAAKARTDALLATIQQAKDPQEKFAQLASQYSDDPLSKRNNGSIGYVGRGQLPAAYDTALFNIESIGAVAGPVRTDEGWVLIQLLDERAGKVKPFAEVKKEVKGKYYESKVSDRYFNLGNKLANMAFEHPDSLKQVSEKLGLEILTVSGVTREAGEGVAANENVREAAFSNAVLKQHMNSETIKVGDNTAIVLRVTEVQPSKLKPLSKVRDGIVSALNHSRSEAAALRAAQEAIAKLRSSKETLSGVAQSLKVSFQGPSAITRSTAPSSVPAAVVAAVFDEPVPADGKTVYGKVRLTNGSPALYALLKVVPNTKAEITPQQRQAYVQQLSRLQANNELNAYLELLRAQADIQINESNIP